LADLEAPAERRQRLLELSQNVRNLDQTMRGSIAQAALNRRGGFTFDEFIRRTECVVDEEYSAAWFKARLDE
jgi:hypothetical protein